MGTFTYPLISESMTLVATKSGYPPLESTTPFPRPSFSQTRIGYKTPNRTALLQSLGYIPPTPYNGTRLKYSLTLGVSTIRWGNPPEVWTETTVDTFDADFQGPNYPNGINDSKMSKAVAGAIASCNSQLRSQSMSLIEDLAEGRQTVGMITDAFMTLVRAGRKVKKYDFIGGARELGIGVPAGVSRRRSFHRNWLEYRYGWGPLLYEIYGAIELLSRDWKTKEKVYHIKGTSKVTDRTQSVKSYLTGTSGVLSGASRTKYTVKRESSYEWKVQVGYYFSIKNEWLQVAQGVGLTNPLLVAWELTPLSFVADWAVNVSDVIAQLDAWTGKTFLSGYQTKKFHESSTKEAQLVGTTDGYTRVGFTPSRGTVEADIIERVVLNVPPPVGLVLRPQLNPKRLVDAVALLKQTFR